MSFADLIVPDLRDHLDPISDPAALAFTSPNGAPLRHSNFYPRVWMLAMKLLGLVGLHIQDLRHAGSQLTSDAGASLREIMERMGHDSTRAVLIYQHLTDARQRAIAGQVSKNARAALGKRKQSGTRMARKASEKTGVTSEQYDQVRAEVGWLEEPPSAAVPPNMVGRRGLPQR